MERAKDKKLRVEPRDPDKKAAEPDVTREQIVRAMDCLLPKLCRRVLDYVEYLGAKKKMPRMPDGWNGDP